MFQYIYEWIHNLSVYLILMTAVLQVLPTEKYKKYIQFYMGLVVILLLCAPVIKIMGLEENYIANYQYYSEESYENILEEIKHETEYLSEVELDDYIAGEIKTDR